MREILFKAKRKDNGEWVEGNLVHCEDVDESCKAIIIPKTGAEMYEGIEGVYEDDLKRKDNGEWVEGNLVHCEDVDESCKAIIIPKTGAEMYEGIEGVYEDDLGFEKWYKVDPNTLCQYTGLTDKNGKEIWGNDIVCVTHEKYQERDEMEVQPFFPEPKSYKRNYHVEFVNSGCCYGCRVRNKSIHFMLNRNVIFNHKVEAIGNVFDNPELLEVE